jgi:hypothetical protein
MSDEYRPYETTYPAYETSVMAIVSLISGILGWLGVFGLGGIIAVVTGHIAKNQIRDSAGRVGGDGIATAGLVLGYLNIAFAVLAVCLVVLVFTGVIAGAAVCPFLITTPTY